MFIINTIPLGSHKTMADYANFLIRRYSTPYLIKGCDEIHVLFDSPENSSPSPKQVEQQRRDATASIKQNHTCQECKSDTQIKGNWRENNINCRTCKRSLVKFIGSYYFKQHTVSHDFQSEVLCSWLFWGNIANTTWYVCSKYYMRLCHASEQHGMYKDQTLRNPSPT